jgi:hypothetical protein
MTFLRPDAFPRPANAAVVLLDTAQTGILACGMMLLTISGVFDLSIGGILAFSGILAGMAAKDFGMPPLIAFLIGCAWGGFLGAINGVLVTRLRINALIATLATLSIYRGLLQLVSGSGVSNIGNDFTVFGRAAASWPPHVHDVRRQGLISSYIAMARDKGGFLGDGVTAQAGGAPVEYAGCEGARDRRGGRSRARRPRPVAGGRGGTAALRPVRDARRDGPTGLGALTERGSAGSLPGRTEAHG